MKTRSLNNSFLPQRTSHFQRSDRIESTHFFFSPHFDTAEALTNSCGAVIMSYGIAKPGGFWKRPINRTYHYNFEVGSKREPMCNSPNLVNNDCFLLAPE